jgi:hypothetical protein
MLDSYERLFSKGLLSKEQLFDFGLSETIYVDFDVAENAWETLKDKIHFDEQVFIRGFGRDAAGTHLFQKFYSNLLGNNNVTKDPTNNAEPTKLLRQWSGYSKTGGINFKPIQNYQISHVFGRTKNVYCFTAPWNVVYIPKLIDPFTGHEAKGTYVDEYTALFKKETIKRFRPLIDDFNSLITNQEFLSSIETSLGLMSCDKSLSEKDIEKLKKAISLEFVPIQESA